jgi:hypothetical protein
MVSPGLSFSRQPTGHCSDHVWRLCDIEHHGAIIIGEKVLACFAGREFRFRSKGCRRRF